MSAAIKERDSRLPDPGTVLEREYKGKMVRVLVKSDGFEWEGKIFRSISRAVWEACGFRGGYGFYGLGGDKPAIAHPGGSQEGSRAPGDECPTPGEWIRKGDPRGLRQLPIGAQFAGSDGLVIVGKTNSKTGAITLWKYTSRYPARDGDQNVFGLGFYFKPVQVNGEEVDLIEEGRHIGIGAAAWNSTKKEG